MTFGSTIAKQPSHDGAARARGPFHGVRLGHLPLSRLHRQFAQPCAYEKQFMDLVCIRFEQHRLHAREPPAHHAAFGCSTMAVANGHTASNTPDPIRTRKLSGARPGQYWGGGPPGKSLGCCWLFDFVCCVCSYGCSISVSVNSIGEYICDKNVINQH